MSRNAHAPLFQMLALRHLELKNRIVKAAYSSTNCDPSGYVIDSAVHHYAEVASGGVGLFVTESVAIDRLGVSGSPRMAIWDDSYVPGQKLLVEAVHRHGTPILMQLHHAGPSFSTGHYGGWSDASVQKLAPRAASTLNADQLPGTRPNPPSGLSSDEIDDLITKYVNAALRAQAAGFDGVELHFAVSYLMNSFLSRAWNKRTDQYGGDLPNRARFAVEVVKRVRAATGNRFVIAARINGAEHGARYGDGITYEESSQTARLLEEAGIDLIQIKDTGYNEFEWVGFPEQVLYPKTPPGMERFARGVRLGEPLIEGAERARRSLSIPVAASGGLDFGNAARLIREGRIDLVSFARRLIADPHAPNKLRDGRAADVRPCVRCQTCIDAFIRSEHEKCRVNAAYAKEQELQIRPARNRKSVLVIGGGPAGLEAARVASLRGHKVFLFEREQHLGGLLPLASLVKGSSIEDLPAFVRYLTKQVKDQGVRIELNSPVDWEVVKAISPDAVILSSGAASEVPAIPGMENSKVMTSTTLQNMARLPLRMFGSGLIERASRFYMPLGKRVAIVGSELQAMQLAEFLTLRGRKVTLLDPNEKLGIGLLAFHRNRLIEWLRANGATLVAGVSTNRISSEGVHISNPDGQSLLIEADNVIVLAQRRGDSALSEKLRAITSQVLVAGDCQSPGLISDAVEGGFRAACAV